jgi:hypothetical protein
MSFRSFFTTRRALGPRPFLRTTVLETKMWDSGSAPNLKVPRDLGGGGGRGLMVAPIRTPKSEIVSPSGGLLCLLEPR